MPNDPVLVVTNVRLLEQASDLLGRMPDAAYGVGTPEAKPVGPHFRHILDHYSCFVAGRPQGRVDYDARTRDPDLESNRGRARQRILELAADLASITAEELDTPVEIRLECGLGDETEQWSRSTLRRELQFLLSHTIHHFALIGLLLARHGVDPGEEFGVAPSTLKHWRHQSACAPQPG